jgi:hypothetical protein
LIRGQVSCLALFSFRRLWIVTTVDGMLLISVHEPYSNSRCGLAQDGPEKPTKIQMPPLRRADTLG